MKRIIYCLLMICILSSCEDIFLGDDGDSQNPTTNFEYLWNECNEKYAYFDVKNIDWDSVKTVYENRIHDGMSQDELFTVLSNMLNELEDGHVNLASGFNVSRYPVQNLGKDQFNWRTITDHYLPQDYYITGPFRHDFIRYKNIGYVRFASFPGSVNEGNLSFVLHQYQNSRGLILDLRENGGGAVSDVFDLLAHFVEKKTLVYYSRIKNGKERNDFSLAAPAYVTPSEEGVIYKGKVILLVDRGTYSAGSFTTLAAKALPNITIMGDITGGGLGLPNGGQLPNGWTYRFSVTQTLDLQKNPEYENGVPPDIQVDFDWNDVNKDEILERAIQEF